MKVLADFKNLTLAEARLVNWLQGGNRKTCKISGSVPDSATEDVTLRATFIRYLTLGGCDTCRLPKTGLRVSGAYIVGDEELSGSTKGLDFEGATLPHGLGLWACHIPDPIILRFAKVKNLFLNGSDVKADIAADGLQVEGGVFLRKAKIAGEVRLLSARLGGDLDCGDMELQAKGMTLICDGMQAEGSVFLRRAKIVGETRLRGARLGGNLECDGAELQAKGTALNCAGAKIAGAFFLRGGATVSGCIDLTDAAFGSICDDPACWPPELILNRCRYGAFLGLSPTNAETRKKWLALQKPKKYGQDFWPDPYEHCAKVLREMGHGAEATKILIEKERLQRQARRKRLCFKHSLFGAFLFVWLGFWDWVLGWSVSYGRRPLKAFLWLALIWGLGWGVFAWAELHGDLKPNLPQIQVNAAWYECNEYGKRRWARHATQIDCFLAQQEGESYPQFNAFIYSADTLFPVVALEMQSYWIPDDTKPFGKYARWYLWAHIIAGWALTLLAVAGFSGLIKTDNTK